MTSISRFLRSESGATTAEYGIIIVVVAGIAIFVLSQLNGALSTLYEKFNTKVSPSPLARAGGARKI
jgi:Flp pilus assembly pilin Flp